ncbi:MAG: glycosyltransferase [Thermodesulfobacteriota bacterium]
MNALMLLDNFPPYGHAGTEQYVLGLARELAGRGCRVLAVHPLPAPGAPGSPRLEEHGGVAVARVPFAPGERGLARNLRVRDVVAGLARGFGADVAHVHNLAWFTTAALDGLDDARVPALATLHDFSLPCATSLRITGRGEPCAMPPAAETCAACAGLTPDQAALRLDLARNAMLRFRRVVFPSLFSRKVHQDLGFTSPRALRQPLGLPPFPAREPEPAGSPLQLAFLGGITWFKGLDLAVAAMAALPRGVAELSVHGSANNPAYLEQVRAMAPDSVRWRGPYDRQDLPDILARAAAVVLPSRTETFSFVAREALHARVPVLAARAGALPEVVRHEANGLLFPAGDAAALARAISRLAGDPGLLASLRAGIAPVKSMADNATELLAIYESLRTGNA